MALVAVLGVITARPAQAQSEPPTGRERSQLPGTVLEAQERDDGTTSAAPWVIGSGVAAAVVVGAGGAVLKWRTR